MKTWVLLLALIGPFAQAQKANVSQADKVFIEATVGAQTLEEAISQHFASDPGFSPTKQLPEDKRLQPHQEYRQWNRDVAIGGTPSFITITGMSPQR